MTKGTTEINHFAEFEKEKPVKRELLPWWIKFFSWVFMIMGTLTFNLFLFDGVYKTQAFLGIYGFTTHHLFSALGLLIIIIFFLKAFAGYSLWFQKDYAIEIAKIDGFIGIILCTLQMLLPLILSHGEKFTFRFELLFLTPYLIRIYRIEKYWDKL